MFLTYLGVSKNSGIRKWMVYNDWKSENSIKIHDLGVPLFLETLTSRIDDSEMFCDSCANTSNIPVLHTVCNRGVGDARTHGV